MSEFFVTTLISDFRITTIADLNLVLKIHQKFRDKFPSFTGILFYVNSVAGGIRSAEYLYSTEFYSRHYYGENVLSHTMKVEFLR